MIIDTHAHLYHKQFSSDIAAVMERCRLAGVEKILLPNIDIASIKAMHDLVAAYGNQCLPMMGLHPCSVGDTLETDLVIMEGLIKKGGYVAIGETGIDLYWDTTRLDDQVRSLEIHIAWAKEFDLPIVIHARNAFDELFSVFDRLNDDRLRGVFHCFTGNLEQAQHIIGYGDFYLGIGGVLTYKNGGLAQVVKDLPLNRILLETDAPYLAPAPHRGKRNESAYTALIGQQLAACLQLPLSAVAEQTTLNAQKLFRL